MKLFGVKVDVDATEAKEVVAKKKVEFKAGQRVRKASRIVAREVEAQAVDALVQDMMEARGLRPAKEVQE